MKLSTLTKMKLAQTAYKTIRPLFRILNIDTNAMDCKRSGLNWHLDLSEGIDFSIFLLGKFEKRTVEAIQQKLKDGDIVLDIGANIGSYTLPLAQSVGPTGKVYAAEPTQWAFNKLVKNIEKNPDLSSCIVASQTGFVSNLELAPKELFSSWNIEKVEDNNTNWGAGAHNTDGANFLRLDDYVSQQNLQKLDFVKLDVDGFEVDILKSGANTFTKWKPQMMIEFCPHVLEEHGTSLHELLELLKAMNYRWSNIDGSELPQTEKELLNYIPEVGSLNVIAVANN